MSQENQREYTNQPSLAEGFRVRISVLQENKGELLKGTDPHYSENSSKLLMTLNPDGCSLKTFPACVRADCPLSSATLPQSGMMRNGTLFLPLQQVQIIEGKERLLYPTPVAVDCKGESKGCSRHLHKDMVRRICLQAFYQIVGKETVYPHPEFVEQLMGFQNMWTELSASEMQSYLPTSIRSSKRLQTLKQEIDKVIS